MSDQGFLLGVLALLAVGVFIAFAILALTVGARPPRARRYNNTPGRAIDPRVGIRPRPHFKLPPNRVTVPADFPVESLPKGAQVRFRPGERPKGFDPLCPECDELGATCPEHHERHMPRQDETP